MTTRTEAGAEKSFVSALLPWIAAGIMAVVYLLTFDHWLSLNDLQAVARATGRTWAPDLFAPVFSLVTSPFRWLPAAWMPPVMNLFSVVCAFFVLALLARCVALLPHDRTQKQRDRQSGPFALLSVPLAWLPPVLAVAVCGLQLTFWENATTLSASMFDLVLFAYVVRALLEYRISRRESWILRAAVVYAACATDTWLMIALFPAFLAAIIWIKGLSFFQLRFIARLFLCLLAGLLFYLYLPLLHLRSDGFFWVPLTTNFSGQFLQIEYILRYTPHHVQFLLALTSILPLLVIGFRWKSSFGDTSELGITLATWIFHITHAALLAVCIWAAFDTGFGLRDAAGRFPILDANRDKFLPLYFLAALSIGYLSGYFLLVFRPVSRRGRRDTGSPKFLNAVSAGVVCALLVLTPAGLAFKNTPEIRITNGPTLQNYARHLTDNLPPRAVLLSDTGAPLLLANQWLARSGRATNYVFLETELLKSLRYHRSQSKLYPDLWPPLSTNNLSDDTVLGDYEVISFLNHVATKEPIYYLNPSFGSYFEAFYSVPHGLVYELKQYATNTDAVAPPLSDAAFTENENFWKQNIDGIRKLLPYLTAPANEQTESLRQRWLDGLHIPFEANGVAVQFGLVYSRGLNVWGSQAQRMGRLEAAAKHFEEARDLFPQNVVATENLAFNQKLRAGERVTVEDPAAFEGRFGSFGGWGQTIQSYGPFDDATGCLAQGILFARGNLNRQAVEQFHRVLTLAPESLLARLWLARVYISSRTPEKAIPLIDELKARSSGFADAAILPADVFRLEIASDYRNQREDALRRLLKNAMAQKPPDKILLNAAVYMCSAFKDYTNALMVAEKVTEINPNDPSPFVTQGFLNLQTLNFNQAVPPLTRAISLQPTNSLAILYRGLAYLRTDKLDEAQHDYEALQKLNPTAYPAYYGLGEIALRKKDTNAAINYFSIGLTNMAPGSAEANLVADRIKKLKDGSP